MTSTEKTINYNELLKEVLTKEGSISECYSNFHNFSLLNSLLAMIQMKHMGLPITPIACGSKWRELGRTIKDHRKIELCMPVFFTVKDANGKEVLDDNGQPKKRMYYKFFVIGSVCLFLKKFGFFVFCAFFSSHVAILFHFRKMKLLMLLQTEKMSVKIFCWPRKRTL